MPCVRRILFKVTCGGSYVGGLRHANGLGTCSMLWDKQWDIKHVLHSGMAAHEVQVQGHVYASKPRRAQRRASCCARTTRLHGRTAALMRGSPQAAATAPRQAAAGTARAARRPPPCKGLPDEGFVWG